MTDLLKAAEADYKTVLRLWNDIGDEWGMQIVMYHFQQAIEKLIKMLIMMSGAEFPHTHDISRLLTLYPDKNKIPDKLFELAGVLTSWEAETRYGSSLLTNVKTLEECKSIYSDLHELVVSRMYVLELPYKLNDFLRDPTVLMKVMEKHPKDYAEWFEEKFPDGAKSAEEVISKL